MQESFFREDTDGNGETGHDEPTDVQVILSNTVSAVNKIFQGYFFISRFLYWNKYLIFRSRHYVVILVCYILKNVYNIGTTIIF